MSGQGVFNRQRAGEKKGDRFLSPAGERRGFLVSAFNNEEAKNCDIMQAGCERMELGEQCQTNDWHSLRALHQAGHWKGGLGSTES